jgi:MFS family permease
LNYGLVLFKNLGLGEWRPLVLLGIWLTVSIPANITTALIVDKVGRRPVFLVGASGILVSLICECILQALYVDSSNKSGQIAACFFIYLFILFWGVCIDATQYLYLGEIFPTRIRPQGAGFAIWNQQAATIVVLVAGPIALERIAWKFFLVLIIPTALYIPVIYFSSRRQRSVRSKISMHSLGRWLRLSLVRPKQLFSIGKRHEVMKNEERAEALLVNDFGL